MKNGTDKSFLADNLLIKMSPKQDSTATLEI